MNTTTRLRTVCLIGLLALTGCASWFGGDDDKSKTDTTDKSPSSESGGSGKHKKYDKDATEKDTKSRPICPQVAVIRELDTLRDYGGEQPSMDQLVGAGKLMQITGDCEYKPDGIDIAYELSMVAGKGPRLGGSHLSLPFFVAVIDPQGTILAKDMLTANVTFGSDSKLKNHDEDLHVFIPLPKAQQGAGPDYRVLAGFQLTDAQIAAMTAKR